MRQEIIDKMKKELSEGRFCYFDFKCDLKTLENYNGPFIWSVRQNGTSLCLVGTTLMLELESRSASRFSVFRDMDSPIMSVMYFKDDRSKYFYYDGLNFNQIEEDDVLVIWQSMFIDFYRYLVNKYPEEYDMRDKPLEIRFASPETEERFEKALEFAKEICDKSLQECIDRIKKYTRISTNQYIKIYSGTPNSFEWSEMIDDENNMFGGIIFDKDRTENHWQIHT